MLESGLSLRTENPFLGAYPDGLVTCECCGGGGCETKVLMRGNTAVYVYFLYLLEIIVTKSKKNNKHKNFF